MVEFDRDDANTGHIARHGVEPDEAEEVLLSPRRVLLQKGTVRGEKRNAYIDQLAEGDFLVVVATRRDGAIRVVTARRASEREIGQWRRSRRG